MEQGRTVNPLPNSLDSSILSTATKKEEDMSKGSTTCELIKQKAPDGFIFYDTYLHSECRYIASRAAK